MKARKAGKKRKEIKKQRHVDMPGTWGKKARETRSLAHYS